MSLRAAPGISLAAKVARLCTPQAYPEHPGQVTPIETHMSWVFLAGSLAYKLKKPVRYDYLDFTTLAGRAHFCREEVRLNQRLAPDVYLGVAPLALTPGGELRVEAPGEPVEWLVKMRRLDARLMLDRQIAAGTLDAAALHRAAGWLVQFYAEAPPAVQDAPAWRAQLADAVRQDRETLADPVYGLPAGTVKAVHDVLAGLLAGSPALFDARVAAGRVVEGHGDLRPEHVCLQDPPVIFDRLEFNRRFRIADAADELAALAMECERLGAPAVGEVLFTVYGERTGDAPAPELRAFYGAHRACVRARLAVQHIHELAPEAWPKWLALAADYLALAEKHTRVAGRG